MIAYHDERVLSKQARVHPYFPLCHVDVSAEVVLFQPRAGSYLGARQPWPGLLLLQVLAFGSEQRPAASSGVLQLLLQLAHGLGASGRTRAHTRR